MLRYESQAVWHESRSNGSAWRKVPERVQPFSWLSNRLLGRRLTKQKKLRPSKIQELKGNSSAYQQQEARNEIVRSIMKVHDWILDMTLPLTPLEQANENKQQSLNLQPLRAIVWFT